MQIKSAILRRLALAAKPKTHRVILKRRASGTYAQETLETGLRIENAATPTERMTTTTSE